MITIVIIHGVSTESFTDAINSSSNFGNTLLFMLIMSEAIPAYTGNPGLLSSLLGGLLNLLIPSKSSKNSKPTQLTNQSIKNTSSNKNV
jgi:hypothetical protein